MIRFSLRCPNRHDFESWFANSRAFDSLNEQGLIACPECGAVGIEKSLMAPAVSHGDAPLQTASTPREKALSELREAVEKNTEDVGRNFASEALAIHEGTAPERAIRGQANLKEAADLLKTGVPVLPLPFKPKTEVN